MNARLPAGVPPDLLRVAAATLALAAALFVVSRYNYLLFHALAESAGIVIAFSIYVLASNAAPYSGNGYLHFVGIAFLFVGGLDLLHMLAYRGMGIFPGQGSNPATQLWIAARLLQAVSMAIAPRFAGRSLGRPAAVTAAQAAAFVLLTASILVVPVFPECYREGIGLTPFKKAMEYVICGILLASGGLLYRKRDAFGPAVFVILVAATCATVASEMAFTFYVGVHDFSNMAGHLLKIVAAGCIYAALVRVGIRDPYDLVFRELSGSRTDLETAKAELEERVRERTTELVEANRQAEAVMARHRELLEAEVGKRTGELAARTDELARTQEALRFLLEDVNETNARLGKANARLSELDRLKSLFIASMSHELRTPLNSIIGFTGILLQGLAGPLNAEQTRQLGMVKGSARHLLDLITDIIDLSKIEAGKIALSVEPFDLARTAREVLDEFRVQAGQKPVALAIEAPEELRIEADARRVRQVLINLVGNAVKFTEKGDVTVSVALDGGTATVTVRDTGPGIRPQDMDRLFRQFSQIGTAEARKHEGTGLGLYLSRTLANRMGGDIRAESEFGRGTVFVFTLPVSCGKEAA